MDKVDHLEESFDCEIMPPSLVELAPILRVVNEVEKSSPKVAHLCRFYAFEEAQKLDPTSSGEGVRQFKTALQQCFEGGKNSALVGRVKKGDIREMWSFYQHQYKKYIQVFQMAVDEADCTELPKAYQTVNVLSEVLKAVNLKHFTEVDSEIFEAQNKVAETTRNGTLYNILSLGPENIGEAMSKYPEIQAAVFALRNTRGLPWPKDHKRKKDEDILDWIQQAFGFLKHNVENQRGHLILLLAKINKVHEQNPDQQPKLDDRALTTLMKKVTRNYRKWCKALCRKASLWLPTIQQEVQQRKLLYLGLMLLIWGEASDLIFMPEFLCYVFHHTAFELYGLLAGNVSVITGAYVRPTYAGEEAFLRKVITPVYEVIAREAKKSKRGKLKDLQQRNYDVLNQYFRSVDCFRLGWPLRPDILHMPLAQLPSKRNAVRNYCGDSSANIKNPICFPEHLHFLQNVWCITKHPYASLWLMA